MCYIPGLDLNPWLLKQGLAVAYLEYSRDYAGDEAKARAAKVGLWSGTFQGTLADAPDSLHPPARARLLGMVGLQPVRVWDTLRVANT